MIAHGKGLILLLAVLGVLAILAGLASRRLGAPILLVFTILLVFIGLGMPAGPDGVIDDFYAAYLIGSVAR